MTGDPLEGLAPDGTIVTGSDRSRVPPIYEPLLMEATHQVFALGAGVTSLYLYGSVATGRAVPPASDVDLLAVVADESLVEKVGSVARHLSQRHAALAREVAVGAITVSDLFSETTDGYANRCFLKHYCVLLQGRDLGSEIDPCEGGPELAWAFNHNIASRIATLRDALLRTNSPEGVAGVATKIARSVLLACGSLMSIETLTWTTDRARAVELLRERHPERADDAETALSWCTEPTQDRHEVEDLLDGFVSWVVERLESRRPPPRF